MKDIQFLIKFCGKKILLVLFFASLFSLILDLLSIALIFPFLKLITEPNVILSNRNVSFLYKYFNFKSINHFIYATGVGLILIYMLKLLLKTLLNKIKYSTSNNITYKLSTTLFKGMLEAKYSIFTEESTSEMVGIINAHTIHSIICLDSWILILNETSFLLFIIIAFIFINPTVTLSAIAIFIFLGITVYIGLSKKINKYGQIHSKINLLVYKFAFAIANTIKDIKIMGLEKKYGDKFSQIWGDYSKVISKSKTVQSIPRDFSETLVFSSIVIICLCILATNRNMVEMIPMLGVIAVSAMRILPSFNNIVSGYNQFKFYKNSLVMVKNLYEKLKINKHSMIHVQSQYEKEITINKLFFKYSEKPVLDSVSITIQKGSSVAFVGPSGAGKSTLLDILVGLREAGEGEFKIDGHDFDPFKTDILRTRIGYVPQNVSLIDDTVAYNISFEENYDKKKMENVIKMARLSQYISELQQGVNTIIGESGIRVSGGQRQRIGIARALYRDPEILIFDEATSALDNITERELMGEIKTLSGTKTIIIVAHRLSTVEHCNTIFLLHQGKIIGQGTHQELLKKSSEYQNLYHQHQY